MMNPILKLFYHLTCYVPRRLPTTEDEYSRFKTVLVDAYGVPNEPNIWTMVAGQVTSTDPHRLRKPWGKIANACKRLAINELAMKHKYAALQELQARLEGAIKRESDRIQAEIDNDPTKSQQPEADAVPSPSTLQ